MIQKRYIIIRNEVNLGMEMYIYIIALCPFMSWLICNHRVQIWLLRWNLPTNFTPFSYTLSPYLRAKRKKQIHGKLYMTETHFYLAMSTHYHSIFLLRSTLCQFHPHTKKETSKKKSKDLFLTMHFFFCRFVVYLFHMNWSIVVPCL